MPKTHFLPMMKSTLVTGMTVVVVLLTVRMMVGDGGDFDGGDDNTVTMVM